MFFILINDFTKLSLRHHYVFRILYVIRYTVRLRTTDSKNNKIKELVILGRLRTTHFLEIFFWNLVMIFLDIFFGLIFTKLDLKMPFFEK